MRYVLNDWEWVLRESLVESKVFMVLWLYGVDVTVRKVYEDEKRGGVIIDCLHLEMCIG